MCAYRDRVFSNGFKNGRDSRPANGSTQKRVPWTVENRISRIFRDDENRALGKTSYRRD